MAEEEKEVKETTETNEGQNDYTELLEELGKLNLKTPEDLQKMARESSDMGRYANEVGDLRKQVKDLTAALSSTQQKPTDDYYSGTETVDLGPLVGQEVRKALKELQQESVEQQRKTMADIRSIQTDPDYKAVEGIWNQYLNSNPQVTYAIQSGERTYRDEYNKVVRQYYRTIAEKSKSVIEGLASKQTVETPHIESGQDSEGIQPENPREPVDMNKINESRASGALNSDDALQEIINKTLPADDAIFRF